MNQSAYRHLRGDGGGRGGLLRGDRGSGLLGDGGRRGLIRAHGPALFRQALRLVTNTAERWVRVRAGVPSRSMKNVSLFYLGRLFDVLRQLLKLNM